MGLFDFFKSKESKKSSIDLTDFKFLSDDHSRIENGRPTNANNKGSWRGIRVKTSDNLTFFVTMYNMNGIHPVWGDNIQMAEKQMKIIEENNEITILRGFGTDLMGASYADFGLTLHKVNNIVNMVTLHMHDRNIIIVYDKARDSKPPETLNHDTDFENFKLFTNNWNTNMQIQEKMQIAFQSDAKNNLGCDADDDGDYRNALIYFEQALKLMPNNDDALKNLKRHYKRIGDYQKFEEVEKKLNYLG